MDDSLLKQQKQSVLDGDSDKAVSLAREAIESQADLNRCIDFGFVAGIKEVGQLFEEGEYFLPELMQGADAMKAAMDVLRPELLRRQESVRRGPKVVIGTVQGDIHDIGKTLVATMLEANGFTIIDLGRDVPFESFVDKVIEEEAPLLALSALLTTTMPGHGKVIELLESRGAREKVRVMVGGAPVTQAYSREIGADGFAPNAAEAVDKARELTGYES